MSDNLVVSSDVPIEKVETTNTEIKQVQLPWRRVHNRGSFYLRQHIQSEVRQVEEMTEYFVKKWYEFPRDVCREVCEVADNPNAGGAFKYMCELTKRMMYFCGFSMTYKVKKTETKTLIIYEWKPLPIVEAEKMVQYEESIMPTKEQLEEQRKMIKPSAEPQT